MYCPLCGKEMVEVSKSCDHIDCEWEGAEDIDDSSIHWGCTDGCFPKDHPLIQHASPTDRNILGRINERFSDVGGGTIFDILWTEPRKSWSLTFEG